MMDMRERITKCYNIPENAKELAVANESTNEWVVARRAVDEAIFKAGYDKKESEFDYNPDYLDFQKGVETGRGLGIRKVVEFYNSMGFAQIDSGYVKEKLKAKLKEWGIDNEKV